MRKTARSSAIAGAALLLCGCQSFPLTSWMFKDARPAAAQELRARVDTASAYKEGSAHLAAGRIGAAIASFKIARLAPAEYAPASNGLAIAYARVGRSDLAARYFRAAVLADPGNMKYAANLVRLERSVLLARQQDAARSVALVKEREQQSLSETQGRLATSGPVERISRAEVRVRTSSNPAAPARMAVLALHPASGPSEAAAADAQSVQSDPPLAPKQQLTVLSRE